MSVEFNLSLEFILSQVCVTWICTMLSYYIGHRNGYQSGFVDRLRAFAAA